MFLRANHFDVPATVNMIKNFRWMFQTYPQYFQNAFDAEKARRVEEIFERHIQVVPSLRDSKGRRLMIYQVPEILGILRELMWFLEPTIKWIPPHEKLWKNCICELFRTLLVWCHLARKFQPRTEKRPKLWFWAFGIIEKLHSSFILWWDQNYVNPV